MSVGTGRHDLIRAVLESAGYGMRQMLEIEETRRGSEVGEVLIVGGWTTHKEAHPEGRRGRRPHETPGWH
jgi:sugar (pentulose or hexulose) kinase